MIIIPYLVVNDNKEAACLVLIDEEFAYCIDADYIESAKAIGAMRRVYKPQLPTPLSYESQELLERNWVWYSVLDKHEESQLILKLQNKVP